MRDETPPPQCGREWRCMNSCREQILERYVIGASASVFGKSSWTNTRNHSALQLSTYLSQLWTCFWQTGGKLKAEALLWGNLVGKINIYLHAVGFPPGISNF